MHVSIPPVQPVSRERKSGGEYLQERKPIDTKVRGVVLARITQGKGGLLPVAGAPQIVIDLLPAVESVNLGQPSRSKKKARLRKVPFARGIPLGLRPVDPEGGINALMQFILHVPGFAEAFFFAPRSFAPFHEFIDQYHHDRQESRLQSSANGMPIFRLLSLKVADLCLHEIFHFIIRALQANWILSKSLEEALQSSQPPDLFITKSSHSKQIFIHPELGYDLDAFIEFRPDGVVANFFTYVKVNGSWYQCDDERITQFRSPDLNLPLSRAILLHYKRISFSKTGWV